ncbi:hypothetical protein SPAN111604_07385 [Sphingomonas antarctica]|uniref:CsgG/HfaB family protein n=1 Tax=Sphingomonas antarctica TaxID=2040274 RepID=UPI0039ED6D3E
MNFSRFFTLLMLLAPVQAWAQKVPVVTVRQMQDLANTGQAKAFSQMIQSAIAATGKFRVIESNFGNLRDQQELGNSGMVTTNRPGKRGGFEGSDFIIDGTITSGSAGKQSDEGANVGRKVFGQFLKVDMGGGNCAKVIATLAVDVKVTDAATGEIRFTKNINQTTTGKTSCSGDPQLDLTNMLRGAANQIASGLLTTIYPMKVAAVQSDGSLLLNYGEGTVAPDTLLAIFAKGQVVIDPDTGRPLTSEGAQIGLARVTEVQTRFSKATPEGPFSQPPQVGYIVRVAPPTLLRGKKGGRK